VTLPTADTGAYWATNRGQSVIAAAWGIPLVREGRILRNAGGGSTPGVLVDPAAPVPSVNAVPGDPSLLVLHDVIDLEGRLAAIQRGLPQARAIHRYDALMCQFGGDPAGFVEAHLSSRRRRRLRADSKKLEVDGPIATRWLTPSEATEGAARFQLLLDDRVAQTHRWDGAVSRQGAVASLWSALGGKDLSISVMTVGDTPVSYRSGFVVGSSFVEYMPVVDRRFEQVSIGDLHMSRLLAQLAALGVTRHLMGKGISEHKTTWATDGYTMWGVVAVLADGSGPRVAAWRERTKQRARRQLTARGLEPPLRLGLHYWHLLGSPAYRDAIRRAGRRAADRT
jgi:CelD/BcsL family acetyltransferase involved in cellulose biosynthesis